MKRKLFSMCLLLSIATGLLAYDFKVGDLCYNITNDTHTPYSVEVTYESENVSGGNAAYSNLPSNVIIPESVTYNEKSYTVTSIGDWAFLVCRGLTSITIPNTVTSIGDRAFRGCTGLTSVTIPNSVTSISSGAFEECTGLTSISIPNSVTSIGDWAFNIVPNIVYYGTATGSPWSARSINGYVDGYLVYEDATKTKLLACFTTATGEIVIPNSVTSIEFCAFFDCAGLTSITIPNSVTSIEYSAFSGCTGLTSITIPNSVTSIGSSAFNNTPWYNNQPDGVVYINNVLYTYKGTMPDNTSIAVREGTISISPGAFYGCRGLTSITIPNSVTSIGGGAFSGCTGLTSITIPNSVTSIGESAFYRVLNIVYDGTATGSPWDARSINGYVDGYLVYEDDTKTKLLACFTTATGEITIPNSVTSIGEAAFLGCRDLTSITIPNSVTSIGWYAFEGCTGLTSITIPNSVTSIGESAFYRVLNIVYDGTATGSPWDARSINGYVDGYLVYEDDTKTKLLACFTTATGEITIPNSVTSIGEAAFLGCRDLTSITIPNSVTSIGWYAFEGCTGLTSVTIGNGVTSIGWYAFEYSRMHKFVCMSPDVEFFGKMPRFSYALDTIIASARLLDVEGSEWLTQPKYLKHAELTNGEMTDNVCRVLNRSYKTLLTLDLKGVSNTTIADEAFKGCYNLKTLRLPAQLTNIPYMAVADCKSLQEITIPATVEEIDNSAFENCRSIRSITFEGAGAPQGAAQYAPTTGCALWRIGNWAFYNCHELQNLLIPEGVTEIGDAAFYGCVYLQDMVLPSTIETIGDNAFALCGKLQKITVLSTTPPTIEAKTFYDVNRAIPVYVPAEAVADYKNDRYWKEFNIQADVTAIHQTAENQSVTMRKIIRNGQVYIRRGDKIYTVMGQCAIDD